MPGFAVGGVGSVLRSARLADFSPEQLGFLTYGRGVDTTRMRDMLGFEPSFTTEEAFDDFAAGLTPTGGRVERLLTAAIDQLPPADQPAALSSVGGDDRG
jgi:UDP-glucose 4-epimerase